MFLAVFAPKNRKRLSKVTLPVLGAPPNFTLGARPSARARGKNWGRTGVQLAAEGGYLARTRCAPYSDESSNVSFALQRTTTWYDEGKPSKPD